MVTVREATISDIDIVYDLIIAIAKYHDQEQYVITSKQELINSGFGSNPSFGVLIAKGASQIKWEVEQDNYGAIKFYERLGAKIDVKGLFKWDITP